MKANLGRRSHSALELRRKKIPCPSARSGELGRKDPVEGPASPRELPVPPQVRVYPPLSGSSVPTTNPNSIMSNFGHTALDVEQTKIQHENNLTRDLLHPHLHSDHPSHHQIQSQCRKVDGTSSAFSSSPELRIEHRKFNSLPPSYKHRKRPCVQYLSLHEKSGEDTRAGASLDPAQFQERVRDLRKWMSDLSEEEKLSVLQSIFPYLGPRHLHWIDSQVPQENPGLHSRCGQGCGDPFQVLPGHIVVQILGYLEPLSLCRTARVSSLWNQYSRSPSVWRNLCNRVPWKISKACTIAQIEKFTGSPSDWRGIFKERYKLRRSWLAGQSHVRTFQGHAGGISCIQFDTHRIVSGSHDKTIKVWNTKTNSPWSVMTLTGHSGEVRCLHLQSNKLVSGSTDLTIKVWDLDTQPDWSSIACRVTMMGHSDTVRCVQMDLERNVVISGSYDSTLKIWDLQSGCLETTLRGHSGYVLAIHHTQGPRLISSSADKSVRIWNLDTNNCVGVLQGHTEAVTCVTMDSTESRIISGSLDRTIRLWSAQSLQCVTTLDWMSSEGHTGVIRDLQADDWRLISAADDKTIKVWDLATGKRLVTLKSHTDGVTCLQFNDFYIVSGSYDKTVKLWDFTVC